jgi:predicted ArsR family transcriptional regulator
VAELTDTKRRIVERLKRVESATAATLAAEFELTDTAIRQHLDALESNGLVERHQRPPEGRGRPPVLWRLTDLATDLFPDRHADLTVELVESIRTSLGNAALDTIIAQRTDRQLSTYRQLLPKSDNRARVQALAVQRSVEGYLAEVQTDGDDMVLIEHHCPIHDAATACLGLCAGELQLFQKALGNDVVVTREQHMINGDARCTYRISPRPKRTRSTSR